MRCLLHDKCGILAFVPLFMLTLFTGCQSSYPRRADTPIRPDFVIENSSVAPLSEANEAVPLRAFRRPINDHTMPTRELRLGPGDEVEISFFGTPSLDRIQKVRLDGRLSLPLVGEVYAKGKTPAELQSELVELYDPQLQQSVLTVTVKTPTPVYVLGSVQQPGQVDMERPLTVLDAIVQAGGFDDRKAEVKKIVVIRQEHGRRFGYIRNLKAVLKGEEDTPFYLKPLDIVYVPRTRITRVNQWIEQYINNIIPRPGKVSVSSDGEAFFTN